MIKLLSSGRHDLAYLLPLLEVLPRGTVIVDGVQDMAKTVDEACEKANYWAGCVDLHLTDPVSALVVVGDRPEILLACTLATMRRIPIAHLHGGEVTEGAIDNVCRNAISQLARWHFVAHEDAAGRLRYMNGPGSIHVTGSPAIDLLSRKRRDRTIGEDVILSYHPETLSDIPVVEQARMAAYVALSEVRGNGKIVCTGSNPDAGGVIVDQFFKSLGYPFVYAPFSSSEAYWDALAGCRCLVGNSSSGVIEAPALGVRFVEVGNRQKGRYRGSYGDGKACARIAAVLGVST